MLGTTQTITIRHTQRYGQGVLPQRSCRSPMLRNNRRNRNERDGGQSYEEDFRVRMRADRESAGWSLNRKSRCRFGLECDCGQHGRREQSEPNRPGRYAAIVQLAVFEAVNSITHKYQPYLGTITAPADASPDAAAVEAAYQVLIAYFGASQTLSADYLNSMSLIPNGPAKTDGIATGDAAAAAMIALRANDGSSPPQFYTPGPPVPGAWQATPSCPVMNGVAVGTGFQWPNVTPFGIRKASDFVLHP